MQYSTILSSDIYIPKARIDDTTNGAIEDWIAHVNKYYDPDIVSKANMLLENKTGKELLLCIFTYSPYLSSILHKDADFFLNMIDTRSKISGYDDTFNAIIEGLKSKIFYSKDSIMAELRIAKRHISLLIALADITGIYNLEEVTQKLSIFAEISVQLTCNFLLEQESKNGNIILSDPQSPQLHSGLVVLAMGKLGSYELNYSSDIDLIVFYEKDKINYIGKQSESRFFIRFTQSLAEIISERTKDGYVFRVDLRLRPDPGSMPPAVSLDAAEIYYETVGQNWERAAMIKARAIAGDPESCKSFMDMITPYVWRRSLDFASIEDIHSIKRQIDAKQGNLPQDLYGYNVKLGHGGIREIEFFAQTQQLIFGGRRPYLQNSATCGALQELVHAKEISQNICDELNDAYVFYRTLEHRLQMVGDQQTHTLPESEEGMNEIAHFMGFEDGHVFTDYLLGLIKNVMGHYSELFDNSPSLAMDVPESYGNLVFTGSDNDPETVKTLTNLGFHDAQTVCSIIRGWHHGRRRATRTTRAREILTELMPVLIISLSKSKNPDMAFKKFDEFLTKLPAGVQIFSLFYSNPALLDLISYIMGSYPQIADMLSRNPNLLDYVLAPEFYSAFPKRTAMEENINKMILQNPQHDLEHVLHVVRNWTNDRRFRVAIQLIKDKISHRDATRTLSRIADISVETVFDEVEKDFRDKHGSIPSSNFAIVALGKLGGEELTFASDLDLVFIYELNHNVNESNGEKPLPASQYFIRLSRRFVAALTAMTREGRLYDVDIRLRPSGNDGPAATTLEAFNLYYGTDEINGSAWAWEFMALTRARVITGSQDFRQRVEETIKNKLQRRWNHKELIEGLLHIHAKMKDSKYLKNPLAVKNVDGGLIDLEYIIQYLQLNNACDNPMILQRNTKRAIRMLLENNILSKHQADLLIEAEQLYSRTQTAIRLISTDISDKAEIEEDTKKALALFMKVKDFNILKKKLVSTQKKVQKLFKDIIR